MSLRCLCRDIGKTSRIFVVTGSTPRDIAVTRDTDD